MSGPALRKTRPGADDHRVTRFIHQCGAALQFMVWIALWLFVATAVIG